METLGQLQARLAALQERIKKETGAWKNELWIVMRGLEFIAQSQPSEASNDAR